MSIRVPGLKTKTQLTRDTGGKIRRYAPPNRAKLLNKLKKLKKTTKTANFDQKLKPVLMRNVLSNTKKT